MVRRLYRARGVRRVDTRKLEFRCQKDFAVVFRVPLARIDENPCLFQMFNDKDAFDCLFKIARDLTAVYPQKSQIFHPIFEDDFVENVRRDFLRFSSDESEVMEASKRADA